MLREMKIDEEWWSREVAADLLWHAENSEGSPKLKAACLKVALYYMTFDQVVQYMGSTEAAEEVFHDQ